MNLVYVVKLNVVSQRYVSLFHLLAGKLVEISIKGVLYECGSECTTYAPRTFPAQTISLPA